VRPPHLPSPVALSPIRFITAAPKLSEYRAAWKETPVRGAAELSHNDPTSLPAHNIGPCQTRPYRVLYQKRGERVNLFPNFFRMVAQPHFANPPQPHAEQVSVKV